MSLLHFINACMYDPARSIDGEQTDLWVDDGKIVASPDDESKREKFRTIDLQGDLVMPGGIDLHCHIAGPLVQAARRLTSRQGHTVVPHCEATGRLFAGMGYTTAVDAAIPGLQTRLAHDEFSQTPLIDRACLLLVGNNHFVLEKLSTGDLDAVRAYLGWAVSAVKAWGLKIVNPGGVENWKQISRQSLTHLDQPVGKFGVTPRQIVSTISRLAEELHLPHAVHIHCNNLGMPGNWETTLATMKAIEGHRAHFAHVQFHSYGGDPDDGGSFCSGVDPLVAYVHAHPEITIDVGHIMPGDVVTVSADGPVTEHLWRLTKKKWFHADIEQESSCGVIPGEFVPRRSLIHAVQWAIGLEWYLKMQDPWRMALASDHPNGGAFVKYPQMIAWLMDRQARLEIWNQLPAEVRKRSDLGELTREYTFSEIAIVTRAAPARILGMSTKGHLGPGADADLTVYHKQADLAAMFARPRYVYKQGELIVEDGELLQVVPGKTLAVEARFDPAPLEGLGDWMKSRYSIHPANYAIDAEELRGAVQIVHAYS